MEKKQDIVLQKLVWNHKKVIPDTFSCRAWANFISVLNSSIMATCDASCSLGSYVEYNN